jgi:hypothetical protein
LRFSGHTATPFGKIGAQPHTALTTTTPTSLALTRQAAQQQVELVHAHGPIMLAHVRRVRDVPLDERLQSISSDCTTWPKTMLPVINQSVRGARAYRSSRHPYLFLRHDRGRTNPDHNTCHHDSTVHKHSSRTMLPYSTFASAFSMQEPGSPLFPQTFAGSFLGAAAPFTIGSHTTQHAKTVSPLFTLRNGW